MERKQVLYDLRTTYSGPFVVEEFYALVDKWASEHGYEKEQKKKMEHVTKSGKKIEWLVQIHSHLDSLHHGLVVLRVLVDNLKESSVKKGKRTISVNHGDVFVNIDCFIQSHIHGSFYQSRPIYYILRSLIDKYVYNFWSFKWDGAVNAQGQELFKLIREYFEEQRRNYF